MLDGGDRLRIVDTLIAVLDGAYCHLPQKRAAYAVEPVQALRVLRGRVGELSDPEFHLAVTSLITGLRDAHTRYTGPAPLQGKVAVLPFLVEQYGDHDEPTFIVSKVSNPALIGDEQFVKGAVLESWNGIPFARAIDLYADRETGGRPDAQRARALESLTFRALDYGPPPDERWVIVGYRPRPRSGVREVRIAWRLVDPGRAATATQAASPSARHLGVNPAAERVRRAKKLMFSGSLWQAERVKRPGAIAKEHGWLPTELQATLAARVVSVPGRGDYGYLRIWSFDLEDDDAFVAEVGRLLDQLPDRGLILDVRANPGGLIWAAERLLQLFTPNSITPTRFSLVATPLTRAMAASAFNRLELEAWQPSLDRAVVTGDQYSQALPLTDPAWCNDVGQRYGGPVVCVADPNTYSAGDLFAAGIVDNDIGTLVCVGEATGAGGANVWTSNDVRDALSGTPFAVPVLAARVGYTLAIRRAIRSARADGTPIEDVGVPGVPYAMTKTDLLGGNDDLIAFCADILDGAERTAMRVSRDANEIVVTTDGLDELELYGDRRPLERFRSITDGAHQLDVPDGVDVVELVGRRQGEIRQRRRVSLR